MNAFIYQAALHCPACIASVKAILDGSNQKPANVDDETTFDSDNYPKGPVADGGGESDSFQHCDSCGEFLGNSLTTDGISYTIGSISRYPESGAAEVLDIWAGELKSYDLTGKQKQTLNRYFNIRESEAK